MLEPLGRFALWRKLVGIERRVMRFDRRRHKREVKPEEEDVYPKSKAEMAPDNKVHPQGHKGSKIFSRRLIDRELKGGGKPGSRMPYGKWK